MRRRAGQAQPGLGQPFRLGACGNIPVTTRQWKNVVLGLAAKNTSGGCGVLKRQACFSSYQDQVLRPFSDMHCCIAKCSRCKWEVCWCSRRVAELKNRPPPSATVRDCSRYGRDVGEGSAAMCMTRSCCDLAPCFAAGGAVVLTGCAIASPRQCDLRGILRCVAWNARASVCASQSARVGEPFVFRSVEILLVQNGGAVNLS